MTSAGLLHEWLQSAGRGRLSWTDGSGKVARCGAVQLITLDHDAWGGLSKLLSAELERFFRPCLGHSDEWQNFADLWFRWRSIHGARIRWNGRAFVFIFIFGNQWQIWKSVKYNQCHVVWLRAGWFSPRGKKQNKNNSIKANSVLGCATRVWANKSSSVFQFVNLAPLFCQRHRLSLSTSRYPSGVSPHPVKVSNCYLYSFYSYLFCWFT